MSWEGRRFLGGEVFFNLWSGGGRVFLPSFRGVVIFTHSAGRQDVSKTPFIFKGVLSHVLPIHRRLWCRREGGRLNFRPPTGGPHNFLGLRQGGHVKFLKPTEQDLRPPRP